MGILHRLRNSTQRNGKRAHSKDGTSSDDDNRTPNGFKASFNKLPIELWQRIFAYVCFLPESLQVDLPDPFMIGGFIPVSKEEERANAHDRTNIQLVCKEWRNITLEFTLRSLVICCQKHTLPLIELLERTKEFDEDGKGYGWWIKELEFRKGICVDAQDVPLQFLTHQEVVRIIRCAPNLRIYRNNNDSQHKQAGGRRTHWSILAALGRYCGRSLLRLDWSGNESPRWDDLEVLLIECPNIQTLSCSRLIPSAPRILPLRVHRIPIYLRYLATLSLGVFPESSIGGTRDWHPFLSAFTRVASSHDSKSIFNYNALQLPSLRNLSIDTIDILPNDSSANAFFSLYGPQLKCLHTSNLSPRNWYYPEYYKWNSWNMSLHRLFELCPQLQSVIFNPMQPLVYPTSHPTLERIGIFPPSEPPSDFNPEEPDGYEISIAKPVEDAMTKLSTANLPRLRLLRLSDTGLFEPLGCSPHWLELWIPVWKEKKIRFEDSSGLDHAIANFDMEGLDF